MELFGDCVLMHVKYLEQYWARRICSEMLAGIATTTTTITTTLLLLLLQFKTSS